LAAWRWEVRVVAEVLRVSYRLVRRTAPRRTLRLTRAGLYGLMFGLRNSPNRHPRVLLNSVLNGSGKFGAKAGNAGGVVALVYTVVERQLEDVELDTLPRRLRYHTGVDISRVLKAEAMMPAVAAFATGLLFTLPRASAWCGQAVAIVVWTRAMRLRACVPGPAVLQPSLHACSRSPLPLQSA